MQSQILYYQGEAAAGQSFADRAATMTDVGCEAPPHQLDEKQIQKLSSSEKCRKYQMFQEEASENINVKGWQSWL